MATRIAAYITSRMLASSVIEEDDRALYCYGFFLLITRFFFFLVTVIVGCLLGIPCESVVFYIAFILLRTYAGGVHAKTETVCTVLTTLALGIAVATIKILEFSNGGIKTFLVFSNLCIWLFSPLDSSEKPLEAEEKRRYRKICYRLLLIYDAVVFAADFLMLPMLYYPVVCGMFLEAFLLSIGKISNRNW